MSFIYSQRFGIPTSAGISILIWLIMATVVHCATVSDHVTGPKFQCRQDNLGTYLIFYQRWPYDHTPLFGYWDSYDNKLSLLVEEPYSKLFVTTVIAYLVWFRIVIFARNRYKGKWKEQESTF